MPLTAREKELLGPKMDRVTRLSSMLTHIDIHVPLLISYVYGDNLNIEDYAAIHEKGHALTKLFKKKTLHAIGDFVRSITDGAQPDGASEMSVAAFKSEISKVLNPSTYKACFPYLRRIVHFDGCSELAHSYLKCIIVNLAIRIFKHIQGGSIAAEWGEISKCYDMVALLPVHDEVDIAELQLIVVVQPGECDFAFADASYKGISEDSIPEKASCSGSCISLHADGDAELIEALKATALVEDIRAGTGGNHVLEAVRRGAEEDEVTSQGESEIADDLGEEFNDYVLSTFREEEELTSEDGEYEWVLHPTPDGR
ncbi:hypothetical protein B0A48_11285 [Cryoendolithus antarcticus]|uniref:Uncharacterized protein n=1 Tax=Cryoendolithus antarcticus TaxID=1507870 RepID=A0A1V8SVD7_9PEZI|nr:hypothetical protein B0A48_11285 [Cryoendolithus antarcticus]